MSVLAEESASAQAEPFEKIFERLTAPGSPFELSGDTGGEGRRFVHQPQNLGQLFSKIEAYGSRECIIYGDCRLSYSQVTRKMRCLAAGLSEIGKLGDRVAILGANHPDWIMVFWAVVLAGMTPVALNGWWQTKELSHGIDLVGAKILVGDNRRLAIVADGCSALNLDLVFSWDESVDGGIPSARPLSSLLAAPLLDLPNVSKNQPAAMLFTSGTTGSAKAAVLTHEGILGACLNAALAAQIEVTRAPELVSTDGHVTQIASLPFFHVGGGQSAVIGGILGGNTLVIPEGKFDPSDTLALIEREKIDRWSAVPAMLQAVCAEGNSMGYDLSSLKTLGYGAAPSDPKLWEHANDLFPSLGAASNAYGLTETSGAIAMNTGADLMERPNSVGRPFATVDIRIVDDAENDIPVGSRGEILVRGPFVMAGYLNDPRATEKAMSGDGWLRTGDMGRLDDGGFLYLLGRKKDVIIRGGENISADEVERCIEAHDAVAEAAVVAMESGRLGEEVKAVVCLKRGEYLTEDQVQEWVARSLAHFKVPSVVEFRLEPLPRNAAGKLVKSVLRTSGNSSFDAFFK